MLKSPTLVPLAIEHQSAKATLKSIIQSYPVELSFTLLLVAIENALLLAYPLFAGFAVDAILRQDLSSALLYAVVVLAFWLIGAARRSVDTRTFTRIYADLAVPVILHQRKLNQSTSTIAARVVLAREFVDFFERHIPMIATALVSIIGASVMLVFIEPWIGIACLGSLLLCICLMPSYSRKNLSLHGRLNDRLEREVYLVEKGRPKTLSRHYRLLSRLRIYLSNREAIAFLFVGFISAALFVCAIVQLASGQKPSAGHIYAVMTYLWTFVTSLDEAPSMLDQLARLKDIGRRVNSGLGVELTKNSYE